MLPVSSATIVLAFKTLYRYNNWLIFLSSKTFLQPYELLLKYEWFQYILYLNTFFFFQFMLITSISTWFLFLLHLLLLLSLLPPHQFSLFPLWIVPLIILLCLCYYTCTYEWGICNILLLRSQGLSISCHGDTDQCLRRGFSPLLRLVAMSSYGELGGRLILSTIL